MDSCEKSITVSRVRSYTHASDMSSVDRNAVVPIDFSLVEEYPDVLSLQQAAAIAHVTPDTVQSWVKKKYLVAFIKCCAYRIPKLSLMEYLNSPQHRRNYLWKRNNLEKRQKAIQ